MTVSQVPKSSFHIGLKAAETEVGFVLHRLVLSVAMPVVHRCLYEDGEDRERGMGRDAWGMQHWWLDVIGICSQH